ncbi:hypothetical protein OB925_02555 [Aeromonas rivipollensis]|uniref:phage head spike fiber domain-containing protein n=1 Tax=Aeromonas rivipollensis TaxID=948519 RepID=UPI00259F0985|nr:hypothetical protein [Aeromonas rivipollensis]MDM5083745.1 hypothetical protein [Aeromonas rivipollensis]MDM5096123.1 hypothetical protein [Aeromonas rivipollensis]MDM5104324.1 hypothetical protein [Aeromonas rivipollensis]
MAGIWYRAGTVAVTSGSKKVVGTGTTWKNGVYKPDKGHMFWGPDGRAYEVDYVESDTVLYLVTAYAGQSATGQAYSIVISITGQIPAFSRELTAFVSYHQSQMDGWQQLLTGTGDVTLTAPDGTKKTVPTWEKVMNAGNGVVAQATAQAGIATTESSKAAASANLSAGIVAAAALPLPDLWAPLSDSLRLITGVGREIKVGDDVVAQMVNFGRASTATYIGKDGKLCHSAVNEPRFEKEGLLLEGASTNLCPWSVDFSKFSTGPNTVVVSTKLLAPDNSQSATLLYARATGHSYKSTPLLLQPGVYTASCYIYRQQLEFGGNALYVVGDNGFSSSATQLEPSHAIGTWRRYAIQFAVQAADTTVIIHAVVDTEVNASIGVWGYQLEPLPFASSYIPTSGAASTRAADQSWLPMSNAVCGSVSVAAECDVVTLDGMYPRIVVGKGLPDMFCAPRASWYPSNTPSSNNIRIAYTNHSQVINGVLNSHEILNSSDDNEPRISLLCQYVNGRNGGFGHVRNLRIWGRSLSAEQLRAIA